MMELKEIKCPICCEIMKTRIQNREHCNIAGKFVKKHKYYQYYCENPCSPDVCFTTTQSDELSLKLK